MSRKPRKPRKKLKPGTQPKRQIHISEKIKDRAHRKALQNLLSVVR